MRCGCYHVWFRILHKVSVHSGRSTKHFGRKYKMQDGWLWRMATVFFNRVITTYFFNMLTICTQHLYLYNFVIYIYFMYMFLIKQDRVFGILLYSIFTYNKGIIRVLRQWLNSAKIIISDHTLVIWWKLNSNIFNMHNRFPDLFGIVW